MSGYLIYHPKRCVSNFGDIKVYHDPSSGNQDPYVWNTKFLHSYCHITQMSSELGHTNFWISGDTFPNFSHLYCDLVFVVEQKVFWSRPNVIDPNDPLVDSEEAYTDHYQWAFQHKFKRRRRFTLKADQYKSFQPQDSGGGLIDIVPFLTSAGFTLNELRGSSRAGYNSQPVPLGDVAGALYEWLSSKAAIKLTGDVLEGIRRNSAHLASPSPKLYLINLARSRRPVARK